MSDKTKARRITEAADRVAAEAEKAAQVAKYVAMSCHLNDTTGGDWLGQQHLDKAFAKVDAARRDLHEMCVSP